MSVAMTATAASVTRLARLDAARGVAVIAMVVYHLAWDLSHFGIIATNVGLDPVWKSFAQAIAASFLAIAGISLERATQDGIRWRPFLKRLAVLILAALAITIVTWVVFPFSYIFFGILHCIALSSLLALAFRRWPVWALTGAGLIVFILPRVFRTPLLDAPIFDFVGLGTVTPVSNDYEPLFPWFAWVLWGMALARLRPGLLETGTAPAWLQALGRWSLPIYLVHQPLLFGCLMLLARLEVLPV